MSPDVMLLIVIGVPAAALVLLRVNAALAFFSACLGAVLLKFVGDAAADFANAFIPALNGNNLKLAVMLLPLVLSIIFLRKSVKGGRQLTNILPAAGTGLLVAFLAVPLLPDKLAGTIIASDGWGELLKFQALLIGFSALVALLFVWLDHRHRAPLHSKHEKHH